ncbi:MAG TPA: transcription elongation factor [Candidatus Eisenbacteria bacterium]|nr:transcription elongation factor [Candidatus Eisenbacteria bacterium]
MPSKATTQRARRDLKQGKKPSTAAGEFVREEMHHIREGKHGARSTEQAIAIGLSKARRAGVPLKPPRKGQASERTRQSAERAYEEGQGERTPRAPSPRRSQATRRALKREPHRAASHRALSSQARSAARRRSGRTRATAGATRQGG